MLGGYFQIRGDTIFMTSVVKIAETYSILCISALEPFPISINNEAWRISREITGFVVFFYPIVCLCAVSIFTAITMLRNLSMCL